MKKIALIIYLLTTTPAWSGISSNTCTNAGGIFLTKDDKTYCLSSLGMNWWSAFAWCNAIGGTPINLVQECNADFSTSMKCPELNFGQSTSAWTKNVPDSNHAYYINLSNGTINVSTYYRNGDKRRPLCR